MGRWYQWRGETLILWLRLQPGASRDAILGPWGEQRLRVSIRGRPIEGQANSQLLVFMADAFGVNRRQVTLLSGEHSRDKRLAIERPTQLPEAAQIEMASEKSC